MNWAVQVMLQGLFVAGAAVIALWVPWLWVRALAGITLAYFLLRIGQNPMGFWRRLSRMVVIVAIPATVSGINFKINGRAPIAGDPNGLVFSIEQVSGDLLPIVIAVLICAILFDLAAFWVQHRSPAQVQIARTTESADIATNPDGSLEMFHQIIAPSGSEAATVIDATLVIFGLFTVEADCFLHSVWDANPGLNRPVNHQNPLKIAANSTCIIYVGAKIARGPLALWLKVTTAPALCWLRLARGEIRLKAEPQAMRVPFPLQFKRKY